MREGRTRTGSKYGESSFSMTKRLSPAKPSGARADKRKNPTPPRAMRIRRALAPLAAEKIEIEDLSSRHEGHAGKPEGVSETHLRLTLIASGFAGLARAERHRRIHALLKAEWGKALHALSIRAFTPEEAAKRR